ncbi:MAG: aspartate aminotransferase family protein [Chloroflexota bacterium]
MMDVQSTVAHITDIEDAHTSGVYPKRPLALVRGEGVYAWDDAGNRYIDATSGQGVALLGHSHPNVAAAVAEQAQTLISCPEIFYNDRRAELYTELTGILPDEFTRFFLCNSGAEANEGALKVARLMTKRAGVVSAMRGFHGRTMGAVSMTWNPKYRKAFAGWTMDVTHVPYNNIEKMEAAITEETAAVVIEAVQGEGGVNPGTVEYLQRVRDLCTERGALLVIDEIQAGLGRTGRWFAFQHADITPDVIALGKGIAGGVPMGAVVWRGELGQMPGGSHGSTFGGNPLASAAAIATLRTLRDENLVERSAEMGVWLVEQLEAMNHDYVREVRGRGLMVGLELRGRVTPVLKSLQEKGVLALPAGNTVLRLLPPLIITQEQLTVVIDAIREALDENNDITDES